MQQIVLTRPIFVKGKGMPKDGACIFHAGETVTAKIGPGNIARILGNWKGKPIEVVSMISSL